MTVRSDMSVFRRLLPFLVKRQQGSLALLVPLLLIGVAMQLLRPWPMKVVLDVVFFDTRLPYIPDALLTPEHQTLLVVLASAAIVVFAVVDALATWFLVMISARVSQQAVARVRSAIVDRIQAMTLVEHRRRSVGDLIMRVTGDVGMLREFILSGGLDVLRNSILLVGMVLMMLLLDWRLTLVALLVAPPLMLAMRVVTPSIKDAVKKQREKEGVLATDVSEAIAAIPVVQAFNLEGRTRERLKRQNRSSGRAGMRARRLEASLGRTAELVLAVGLAVVLGYGVHRAQQGGALTPGDLVLFTSYVRGLYKPLRGITGRAARLAKASACAARVVEVLDHKPTIQDRPDALEAPRFAGRIDLRRVAFAYNPAEPVLSGVDVTIAAGSFVALVGRSGAGKTTLALLLARLIDPDRGEVRLDRQDIREFTLASVRRQVGLVLQDTILMRGTIAENIAIARPEADAEAIVAAARAAGCDEFIRGLQHGYDTLVGERGATLSGGQARRISLARVLLLDPPVVVLDEPMTGLDAIAEAEVSDNLRRLLRGRTVVLIAHRFTMLQDADQVLVLDGGRIAEAGTHEELLQAAGLYRRLHDARGEGDAIPDSVEPVDGVPA